MTSRPIEILPALNFFARNTIYLMLSGFIVSAVAFAYEPLDTPAIVVGDLDQSFYLDGVLYRSRVIAVGAHGLIAQRSTAANDRWVQSNSPVSITLTAISINTEGVAIAVGHDGAILRSPDAGLNWNKVTDGRTLFPEIVEAAKTLNDDVQKQIDDAQADGNTQLAQDLGYDLEDAAFRLETAQQSIDFGPAWPLLDVLITNNRAYAVGAYGMFLQSEDAGVSWQLASDRLDNVDDFHLNGIHQTSAGSLLIASEGGIIFRSENNGETFERYETLDGLSLFGITESRDNNLLIAYGFGNAVQVSRDDGLDWQSVALPRDMIFIGHAPSKSASVQLLGAAGVVLEVGAAGPLGMQRPAGSAFLSTGLAIDGANTLYLGESGAIEAAATGN